MIKKIRPWLTPVMLLTTVLAFAQPNRKQDPSAAELLADWQFTNFGPHAGGAVVQDKNKMTITSRNTRHAYFEQDFYSFNYQLRAFPYDDCSELAITVTINELNTGAAGIMMRTDSDRSAANVHLETSQTGDILLFYRKNQREPTSYIRFAHLAFPMVLKLVRQGKVFTAYYKNESGTWMKGASVMANVGTRMMTGLYACSGKEFPSADPQTVVDEARARFSDWDFKYTEQYIPPEKNFKDPAPVKPGTLLRDNFNDGSMSNLPATVINPVWAEITYAQLPYDSSGGRYWRKKGDGTYFLGDKKWTDYEVGIDLTFDRDSPPGSEFLLQMRYQNIAVYSSMLRYYAVTLRGGNKLVFEKVASGETSLTKTIVLPGYLDGRQHHLSVRMLDRAYEVYFDHKKLLEGVDMFNPITYGNVALKFTNAAVGVDNLEVVAIDDPVNGSTDNYLQDYFDTPIPAFMKKYGYPENKKPLK